MTELESLPNELLIYILKFLDSTDVIKVAQTCKRLLQICQADILWQHLCQRDFKFCSLRGWSCSSFHEVYGKVLYHYGKFQGFWKLPGNAYGMLVHIKVENGQIVGHVIQPPLSWNVVDPVRLKPLFIITVRDNECVVLCRQGCSAQIKMESEKATFKCETCLGDNKFPHISEQILLAWLEEELESLRGNFDQRMLRHFLQGNVSFLHRIYNLAEQTRYWSSLQLTKVPEPCGFSISPVTPGIFKGTYGSHGLEFVQITLSEDGYTLLGNKLTGDPNVPAGETSLYIDLRQPIRLTTDEQRNIDSLKSVTAPILPHPFRFDPSEVQPFFLCTDLLEREAPGDLPRTCKARFIAKGRIAGHGYSDPSFSEGHFVVFRQDLFGFFWLNLCVFSLFSLMTECSSTENFSGCETHN